MKLYGFLKMYYTKYYTQALLCIMTYKFNTSIFV